MRIAYNRKCILHKQIFENAYCINKYQTLVFNMAVFLVHTLFEKDWLVENQNSKNNKLWCIFPETTTLDVLKLFFSHKKRSMGWPLIPLYISLYFSILFSINRSKEWSQSKPLISRKLYWMANDKCVSVYFYIISLYIQGRLRVT